MLALATAACIAGLTPCAKAADAAPDWLRAAAQEKIPDYDKDTSSVILLDETQITVQDNGEIQTLHRAAVRLLRPDARKDYGSIGVNFDKDTKVSYLKGWTIPPNGHELAVGEKDTVERGYLSDSEYDDNKVKVLQFPEADPGSVVGFEYVQRDRPYIFENNWWFQDRAPVRDARLVLQLPVGWEFTANWFNFPEQKPQTSSANHFVWEVKDVPGIEIEPRMPPWRALAGWVGVKFFPSNPALRAKSSGSWNDVGLWYDGLTRSSRASSPQIQQKVAELTAGITDPLAKMRALTDYMQRNIRYMAVEIGIGGFQPHTAAEVFARQYGDCKDKATLLSSMLHEIGIESYYVLIDTHRGFVHPDYPSVDFNHAILAVRLPDNVPSGTLYSIVRDPKLGRLLIFDPTNESVPLGYLPWYLQQTYGLVVEPDGGNLVSLPLLPPAANRLIRTAKFDLSPSGDLSGEVQEANWGGLAAEERSEFHDVQPARRADIFEHFLGAFLDNFVLTNASLGNLDQYDQDFVINYKFVSRRYADLAGDMLIVRPRVVGDQDTGVLNLFAQQKPRKYPIQFEEATRQDDVFDITLPAGYAIDGVPEPVQIDCEYASYHSETKVSDGVLHYKRTFEIKNVTVPTEKLPEIRDFLQQVAADQTSSAVLRHVSQ